MKPIFKPQLTIPVSRDDRTEGADAIRRFTVKARRSVHGRVLSRVMQVAARFEADVMISRMAVEGQIYEGDPWTEGEEGYTKLSQLFGIPRTHLMEGPYSEYEREVEVAAFGPDASEAVERVQAVFRGTDEESPEGED